MPTDPTRTAGPSGDATAAERDELASRVRDLEQAAGAFRMLVEATDDAVMVLDLDGKVRTWNGACERLYGWSAREVLGKMLPVVPAEERTAFVAQLRQAAHESRTQQVEASAVRKDGSRIVVATTASPLADEHDLTVGLLVVVRRVSFDSRLEQIRDEFVSLVSAELRNPLAAIAGYTQLLGREEMASDPAQRARIVRALESRVRQLSNLLEDLLVASQVQEGRLKLEREPTDLPSILTDAVTQFERLQTAHRFRIDVDTHIRLADVDPRRVQQALTNLLANAAQYSPDDSEIRVSLIAEGDEAVFAIRDDGPGIAPEELDAVFGRFYRAPGTAGPGAGLGLYLVRMIAEAHGGSARARSELGRGATLELRLPLGGAGA